MAAEGMAPRGIGRREDHRFTTGRGNFVGDLDIPDALRVAFVRSNHASARVTRISTDVAREAPGVVAVLTFEDLERDGIAGIPPGKPLAREDGGGVFGPVRPLLCPRVSAVGEPVAMVLAESRVAALDAAEHVDVEFEEVPSVVTAAAALAPDAPRVWPEARDNIAFHRRFGDAGAAGSAIRAAAHVTRLEMEISRVIAAPLEPRDVVARPCPDGTLELITANQKPAAMRGELAAILKMRPEEIRVRCPDVGGSFGMKAGMPREDPLLLWAARRVGRPVRWTATRTESFLADDHGRDVGIVGELALDGNGHFTAVRTRLTVNIGAYSSFRSTGMASNIGGIAGAYRTPIIDAQVTGVFTHTSQISPYRGNGRPEATYVMERLIDSAARETGIDASELRRRNLVTPEQMPWTTAFGITYDCGDFPATLARASEMADLDGFGRRRSGSEKQGRLRGLGFAMPVETAGGPARNARPDSAVIRVSTDGAVTVATGMVSTGQGHETVMPRLVAERLDLPADSVGFVQADTALMPEGRGAGGSGGAPVSVAAVSEAVDAARGCLLHLAAEMFEAEPDEIELSDGLLRLKGSNRTVGLADVARRADPEEGLVLRHEFTPGGSTFPNGCHVAEVEIDPDTGQVTLAGYVGVEDVGTVLNNALVEGQMHGGIAQGAGQALAEAIVYDDAGQLLTASFMDYGMPRAVDLPLMRLESLPVPTKMNPLGAKGVGEAGTVGALAAVMNAVNDALASAGAGPVEMPASPSRVWLALANRRVE